MRKVLTMKLITATALLVLISSPAAMAQTGRNAGGSSGATNSQSPMPREAPVGHRQPRADQVPSEKDLSNPNPNDPINKESAVLDRKIKSICRGC